MDHRSPGQKQTRRSLKKKRRGLKHCEISVTRQRIRLKKTGAKEDDDEGEEEAKKKKKCEESNRRNRKSSNFETDTE